MTTKEVFAVLVQRYGLTIEQIGNLDPWKVKHLYFSNTGEQETRQQRLISRYLMGK